MPAQAASHLMRTMSVYNPKTDLFSLQQRLAQDQGLRVVSYCAAWCRACQAWQTIFQDMAEATPAWTFIWVDIEDSPAWLGDEDVEDFPSIMLETGGYTRLWGVQLPYREHLQRLLEHAPGLPAQDGGPGLVQDLAQA